MQVAAGVNADRAPYKRGVAGSSPAAPTGNSILREPSYLSCWRRTISVIQMGANGDVQFGGVG